MLSNNITIRIENLSKCYNIYGRPQDRLKQAVFPRLRNLVGRPVQNYFHEFWALKDVSFEVKKGETVGVIGRNGSGKSTLLQLICGTLSPTKGVVETNGRIAALLELGSGFNPEFTGRENIYLNGAILGLSKEEIDARFSEIAAFADIGEFIEQPVKMYSSGMVVRLAFSVQAMVDPDILIVDEALSVGDEKFQRKCFSRIEELKNKGTSILFVSHSGSQIIELCKKTLLLDHGERLMFSEPLQAVRAYQKLIYASANDHARLVEEYKSADRAGTDIVSADYPEINTVSSSDVSLAVFDPGLISETKEVYLAQDAEISMFQILDMEGNIVNVLLPGEDYQFQVSGRFLSDRKDIYFGINIRTISGMVVTGQRYPEEGRFFGRVNAQQNFRITYGFKMILMPGMYFVSGGIWSSEEPNCLHRILDALVFRVLPERKLTSFGYANMASMEPLLEIE